MHRDDRARRRAARAGIPPGRSPAAHALVGAIGNRAFARSLPVTTSTGTIETDDYTVPELVELIRQLSGSMQQHGIIDDNLAETKRHIMSTNIALHGGLGHAGEETFHYFQIAKGQTVPDVAGAIRTFLADYKIDAGGNRDPQKLIDDVAAFNDTPEGSRFQILVPRKIVDQVAYLAHPHGLPHDDELFDELHGLTPIRYSEQVMGKRASPSTGRAPLRRGWTDDEAVQYRSKRFREGRSQAEQEKTLVRAAEVETMSTRNPEHFGEGQGIRSKHENMRIRNRLNFIQARMLINEQLMLNPDTAVSARHAGPAALTPAPPAANP